MNVLMYHFVSCLNDSSLFLGVPGVKVEDFETQVSDLIKNGTALYEEDIRNASIDKNYPTDECFYLTFDDGMKQHFNNIYPILMDYGLQASFFIPTMPLESNKVPVVEKQRLLQYNLFNNYQEFLDIFCMLAIKISKVKNKNIFSPNIENIHNSSHYLKEYDFYSNNDRYFRMLRNEYLSEAEFSNIINSMFSNFFNKDKEFINEYYLSIDEIKIMSNNGMVIGGHSYSHPFLNKIPLKEMHKEIDRSTKFLQNSIGRSVDSFSYPYGAFNDDVVAYMRKSKFNYAFTTNLEGANQRYAIGRNDPASFFKK